MKSTLDGAYVFGYLHIFCCVLFKNRLPPGGATTAPQTALWIFVASWLQLGLSLGCGCRPWILCVPCVLCG